MAIINKTENRKMLVMMWKAPNPCALLVGVYNVAADM
jgi:hypothetical protein